MLSRTHIRPGWIKPDKSVIDAYGYCQRKNLHVHGHSLNLLAPYLYNIRPYMRTIMASWAMSNLEHRWCNWTVERITVFTSIRKTHIPFHHSFQRWNSRQMWPYLGFTMTGFMHGFVWAYNQATSDSSTRQILIKSIQKLKAKLGAIFPARLRVRFKWYCSNLCFGWKQHVERKTPMLFDSTQLSPKHQTSPFKLQFILSSFLLSCSFWCTNSKKA